MKNRNIKSVIIAAIVAAAGIFGCSELSNPTGPLSGGQGEMKMYLIDAPAAFDSVIIVVDSVEVHMESEADDSIGEDSTNDDGGWKTVNTTPATYDLLTLQNGVAAVLGDTLLPAGHYTQIRLMIGKGSYVVADGMRHDLTIPSGFETGIKLINEFTIQTNQVYRLTLDFDAAHSIIVTGNGKYMLKPTIRIATDTTNIVIMPAFISPAIHSTIVRSGLQ